MQEVLDVALACGHETIFHPPSERESSRFVLQEMVRAWALKERTVALNLHIIDKEVHADLRSGRLDLAYLVSGRGPGRSRTITPAVLARDSGTQPDRPHPRAA
jgi:hypothetical protein